MNPNSISIIDSEKIHLLSVKVFKANLDTTEQFRDNPEKVNKYVIDTASDTVFNFKDKLCRFRFFFKFTGIDDKQNPLGIEAEYGIEYQYFIENINDFLIHKNDNEVVIDSQLGITLCSISYSTSRGIILEKMRGTYFEDVLLPIVSPVNILESQMKPVK